MDPMDLLVHNNARPSGHYDPVHAASSPWPSRPPNTAAFAWQAQAPAVPAPFSHHMIPPVTFADPFQLAQSAGLPPPALGFHSGPPLDSFNTGMPQRNHTHAPRHLPVPPPPATPGQMGPTVAAANASSMPPRAPGARDLSFQPTAGLRSTPHDGGGATEPNSLSRAPPSSLSDPAVGGYPHYHISHFTASSPSQPPFPGQSRRSHHLTDPSSSRSHRSDSSAFPRAPPTPTTSRRTHPRTRRPMSARVVASEGGGESDDERHRQMFLEQLLHNAAARDHPYMDGHAVDEAVVRQIQLARGAFPNKLVASKLTLRAMQSVRIEDLPESDRTCVICYNDFGVQTPEGVKEAPLRLPKCKHVFGDQCIKKWLEDSDSCPYCRDKLHSEPKQPIASPRSFLAMMRARSLHVPPPMGTNGDNVFYRTLAAASTGAGTSGPATRPGPSGGRRSPPSDPGDQQRRTRPRHNDPEARLSSSPQADDARPVLLPRNGNVPLESTPRPSQRDALPPLAQRPGMAGVNARLQFEGMTAPAPRWTGRGQMVSPSSSSTVQLSPVAPSFQPSLPAMHAMQIMGGPPAIAVSPGFPTTRASSSSSSSSSSRLPNPLQASGGVRLDQQPDENASPTEPNGGMQRADQPALNRPW